MNLNLICGRLEHLDITFRIFLVEMICFDFTSKIGFNLKFVLYLIFLFLKFDSHFFVHIFLVSDLVSFRPSVQFSYDEAIACRMATNEIQFFDARDFSKGIIYRVRIPGIAAVELAKEPGSHVAAFVPESKVCVQLIKTYSWSGPMVFLRHLSVWSSLD